MRKIKESLRLYWLGLKQRQIARACSIGQSTVSEYVKLAEAAGVKWPDVADLDDDQLMAKLAPVPSSEPERGRLPAPDFATVHHELKTNKHVTMQLLWEEYREQNPDGYRYSRYCELYQRWRRKQDVVMRQDHRPGEKLFVDYAGATIPVKDSNTGEIRQAQLFLAVLGASNYTYVELTWSQDQSDWIASHVRAFDYFGAVPEIVVPDNLKSGVTKPCRYEPGINIAYEEMARHYGVAVIPARVRKPRDKAYVSYCPSFRLCNGEDWLLGTSATMALENRGFVQRFVEATAGIVVTVLLQSALSGPKIDCSGGHAVAYAHLFGCEQSLGPQSVVATLQIEGLPNMGNLLKAEWFVLPGPPALSIQNFRDLPVTVIVEQSVDLGDDVRLCLANLGDRQRPGQCEASKGAAAETYMNPDHLPVDQGHILNE